MGTADDTYHIPLGKCNLPTTLRAVFASSSPPSAEAGEEEESPRRQRYFWNCAKPYRSDGDGRGCGFFRWAQFGDDGGPVSS